MEYWYSGGRLHLVTENGVSEILLKGSPTDMLTNIPLHTDGKKPKPDEGGMGGVRVPRVPTPPRGSGGIWWSCTFRTEVGTTRTESRQRVNLNTLT